MKMSVHKARSMLYTWTYNPYMPDCCRTSYVHPQVIPIVMRSLPVTHSVMSYLSNVCSNK